MTIEEMLNMLKNSNLTEEEKNALLGERAREIIKKNETQKEKTSEEKRNELIENNRKKSEELKQRLKQYEEKELEKAEEKRLEEEKIAKELIDKEISSEAHILSKIKNNNGEFIYGNLYDEYKEIKNSGNLTNSNGESLETKITEIEEIYKSIEDKSPELIEKAKKELENNDTNKVLETFEPTDSFNAEDLQKSKENLGIMSFGRKVVVAIKSTPKFIKDKMDQLFNRQEAVIVNEQMNIEANEEYQRQNQNSQDIKNTTIIPKM